MDQNLSQQLSTHNDKSYQTLASVGCMDPDNFPSTHYFTHQPLICNTISFEGMCLEKSQQIYDNSGAFDLVETLSTTSSLEQSLACTYQQPTYLERITCSVLGSRNLDPTTDCSTVPTTFMSLTAKEPLHDITFESATSPREKLARRRDDRRRAQNRAAQRAFRAKKEDIIKENMVKVRSLEENLTCVQSTNAGLSDAVANLTAQVLRLQVENATLKQSRPYYSLR